MINNKNKSNETKSDDQILPKTHKCHYKQMNVWLADDVLAWGRSEV